MDSIEAILDLLDPEHFNYRRGYVLESEHIRHCLLWVRTPEELATVVRATLTIELGGRQKITKLQAEEVAERIFRDVLNKPLTVAR